MPYSNFRLDTMSSAGIIAEDWDAKPPAKLDIAGGAYTITPKVMISSSPGQATDTLNELDQAFVKTVGIFCNFADGLIFDDDTDLYAKIGYTIDDGASYLGAALWVRITALNVMFTVNRFLPEKASVTSGNTLKLLATISGDSPAAGKFGTGSINPDLADTGTHVAGEMPLRFDIVAEVEHSYEVTA